MANPGLEISQGGGVSISGAYLVGLATDSRTVTAGTDTATPTDHTLTLNGVSTENLPAVPNLGQELFLVNHGAAVTVNGNGSNIWADGVSASTYVLTANAGAIIQFDGTMWIVAATTNPPRANLTETVSSVLTISGGTNSVIGTGTTITVKQASGSQSGFLNSSDWTTFNNKQPALTFPLSVGQGGTGATTTAGILSAIGAPSVSSSNTFTGSATFQGGFATKIRSISAADTATTSDHTLICLTASAFTETLPLAPLTGQVLSIINSGANALTIAGNGKNIWSIGTTAATLSLVSNSMTALQYDGAGTWWQISR
jgi:hypothetical protein